MKNSDRIGGAALIAGLSSFGLYWLIFAIIKNACTRLFDYSDNIQAEGTSTLAAFAIGSGIFVFSYALIGGGQTDKSEKVIVLALAGIFVLWAAFVMIDGNVCSPVAWRGYVAYLLVPSLIATLLIVGRKWLNAND